MSGRRLMNWFLTESGKKVCYYGALTATACVISANFLPHTVFVDQYKDVVQLYRNGLAVPISKKIQERFDKTLDLLEIDPVDRHLYKPFHCYGFDVMSAGSSYSRFGVIVGIPSNFTYDNVDMVDKSNIKVNQESVVWDSEDGQKLLSSLILSENAQMYAMAKEIKFRQTPKPILDVFFAASSCISIYSLNNYINVKFNLYAKPAGVRYTMYCLVGLFVLGLYAMSKDMTQLYYEQTIDGELKKAHQIFAEGGREYYTNIIRRNQSLRRMLGKEGESLYSVMGNENSFIRTKHIPVVQRKSFFEDVLKS
ncbi:hypothetical protein NQ315_004586 [Exocentrus adspersus]|uniref:Transmembrane protein 177 n=1 Tax=Exocentrus adspersus TaxID=1586481 RepID=A0AAV8VNP7_9CUCU|nr:hypothetical protein NQ315_004586 [Exocentrus adspersus]